MKEIKELMPTRIYEQKNLVQLHLELHVIAFLGSDSAS